MPLFRPRLSVCAAFLNIVLGHAPCKPEHMDTAQGVALESVGHCYAMNTVHFTVKAKYPGVEPD